MKRMRPNIERGYVVLGYDGKDYYGYVESSFFMKLELGMAYFYSERKDLPKSYKNKPEYLKKMCFGMGNPKSPNQCMYFIARKDCSLLNRKYKHKNIKFRVYRINSKYCPVSFDLTEYILIKLGKVKYDKYKRRNIPFKIK